MSRMAGWHERPKGEIMKPITLFLRSLAAVVAITLIAAACGGGDSAADQEVIDAMVGVFNDEGGLDGVEVDCLAEKFVSALGGAKRIESEYGVTAALIEAGEDFDETPLSESDARKVAKGFLSCDGAKASIMGSFGELTAEQGECLADAIDDNLIESLLASGYMGDAGEALEQEFENPFEEQLVAGLGACGIQ